MGLIDRLKEKQGDMTLTQFAEELQTTAASLSRIYSGDQNVGTHIGKKIVRRYPDLERDVFDYLLDEGSNGDAA